MADRPISFKPPMIRAVLDGRKTQTRRVLKPQPEVNENGSVYVGGRHGGYHLSGPYTTSDIIAQTLMVYVVPYATGDRLWVKEAWRTHEAYDDLSPSQMGGEEPVRYETDGVHQTWGFPAFSKIGRYRHARFMPRWASRLTLIVESVKVERLQDISEQDAIAEGTTPGFGGGPIREDFFCLWNSINGPFAADANPWVAAISFRVIKRNIDEVKDNG